jgi:hypothetical protein
MFHQSQAGSACCNSGKSGVDAAKKANDDMDGKVSTCKSERKAIASSKAAISRLGVPSL